MTWVRRKVRWLKAALRLDLDLVCAVAAEGGGDYHDYPDTGHGLPDHFVPLTCARCGRDFRI